MATFIRNEGPTSIVMRIDKEYFESAGGAFLLGILALILAIIIFYQSTPLFLSMGMTQALLFLTFYMIWGVTYTVMFGLIVIYFIATYSRVPLPPRKK